MYDVIYAYMEISNQNSVYIDSIFVNCVFEHSVFM